MPTIYTNQAQIALESGAERPYELDPGDNLEPPDWAHHAARGIMADMCDRRGIKEELRIVDMDTRKELVADLAAIIRLAHGEDDARRAGRRSIIAKLACLHGGHNASSNSWGRLGMQVDTDDDNALAKYFYKEISADARKPLEEEIKNLKARLYDLQKLPRPVLPTFRPSDLPTRHDLPHHRHLYPYQRRHLPRHRPPR
jgi:hypothetical protein